MSRIENSFKNIKFAPIFQAALAIVSFFTRKVFILVLTKEFLGLNGTFANILSMLSLAELSVGTAQACIIPWQRLPPLWPCTAGPTGSSASRWLSLAAP